MAFWSKSDQIIHASQIILDLISLQLNWTLIWDPCQLYIKLDLIFFLMTCFWFSHFEFFFLYQCLKARCPLKGGVEQKRLPPHPWENKETDSAHSCWSSTQECILRKKIQWSLFLFQATANKLNLTSVPGSESLPVQRWYVWQEGVLRWVDTTTIQEGPG